MARTSDPNSATSQFYICDGAQSFLDDNYAAFGVVIDGMDVLRDIASVGTTTKNGMANWPVDDVTIRSTAGQILMEGLVDMDGILSMESLEGTYTNGEAAVCVYNNGSLFSRDGGCN